MNAKERFDNKRILIWGYGREGKSTEEFLKSSTAPACIDIFEGKREDIKEDDYDYIIKSPGIVMNEDNPKYTSQTDIFLEAHRDKVIGITGTKGKSTTSALLHHVLSDCIDKNVILLGNIGEPCLNYYNEVDEKTVVVFEMSCHQLAHAETSPHISVFLNLYEEHLDYYGTFERYFAAKTNIAKHQNDGDCLYIGENVPEFETKSGKTVVYAKDAPHFDLKILGEHNNLNAYYVFKIATEVYGADPAKVKASLATFEGLAHRLQRIGEKDGVTFYDDSISTIPGATIQALKSVNNAKTVLIGGMDRGIDYSLLIDFIRKNPQYNYICAYESGKRIYDEVEEYANTHYVDDLEAAVNLAKKITKAGEACILSPASASYGYFKNFEHRGEVFKELVGF